VFAEVLNQLFASLPGINPPTVQHDRAVEAVTAPEHGATREKMRGELARRRLLVGGAGAGPGHRVRARGRLFLGAGRRHARIGLALWQIDTDAHYLFEERTIRKAQVDELALALGEIAQRRRFSEDFLEDLETNCRLVVRRRHQDAAGWRDFEPLNGWRVE